jgi:hypothetical protein
MPFFHHEPKKTKPPELGPVCQACDLYEETDKEMSYFRRMLWGNPFLTVSVRRCRHHPHFSDPHDLVKCPFPSYFGGKDMIEVYCDVCKKRIRFIDPASPEADGRMDSREEEGKSVIDICAECRSKGL